MKCPVCQKFLEINIEEKLYKCCQIIPYHPTIESLLNQLEEYLTSCKSDINELCDFLKNTETLLHENHYLRLIAKRKLTQLLSNANKGYKVVEFQKGLIKIALSDSGNFQTFSIQRKVMKI